MKNTPENKVKARVKKALDELGCYHFAVQSGGLGSAGHPDRVACIQGIFVGIECKADLAKKVTELQAARLNSIVTQGGMAFVVDADNCDGFCAMLDYLFPSGKQHDVAACLHRWHILKRNDPHDGPFRTTYWR